MFKRQTFLFYLDNIIIFFYDADTRFNQSDELLTCLEAAGVALEVKKLRFFTVPVEYLGHIIETGRFMDDTANSKPLREANPLTSKSELKYFLGLLNKFRRFIEAFTIKTYPFNQRPLT